MASVDGEGKVCEREGSPLKELSKSFVVGACFFFFRNGVSSLLSDSLVVNCKFLYFYIF